MKRPVRFLLSAVLLLAARDAVSAAPQTPQTPEPQSAQTFEKRITKTVRAPYLLYLPKGYNKDPAATQRWPLVLFLHGAGERGADLEKVKAHGPPKLVAQGKEFPFVLVSPQCPAGQRWSVETLDLLLEDVCARYAIDLNRIYVTGLSMGGFGTWSLALEFPDRFAAIVPIAGGGTAWMARRVRHLSVWAFHGAKDATVPLSAGQQMVDALKNAGGTPTFTVYPDAGHDSWTRTYDNPDLYAWLLRQVRPSGAPAKK